MESANASEKSISLNIQPFDGAEIRVKRGRVTPTNLLISVHYKPRGFWSEEHINILIEHVNWGTEAFLNTDIRHGCGGQDNSLSNTETAKSFVASYQHAIEVVEAFRASFEKAVAAGLSPEQYFFAVKEHLFETLDNVQQPKA